MGSSGQADASASFVAACNYARIVAETCESSLRKGFAMGDDQGVIDQQRCSLLSGECTISRQLLPWLLEVLAPFTQSAPAVPLLMVPLTSLLRTVTTLCAKGGSAAHVFLFFP
jgi:hypothetical protein